MLQAEPDAGSAIAVFVALVVVPSVGAAGGCGGGWQFLHFAKQNRRCSRSSSARRTRRWAG